MLSHIPPGESTAFWFFNGLGRQRWAVVVALLAGYTAVWLALWYSVVGLVVGALFAVGLIHKNSVTRALFHAGASTSLTALAALSGALVGAAGSFAAIYGRSLASLSSVAVGLLSGAILSVVIVAVVAHFEGRFLRWWGCQQLVDDKPRRISPILQAVGTDLRLRDAPRFLVKKSEVRGAWTHMRHIVLTTALLDTLDDRELAAVIAHELHHWRKGDTVGQYFVWACCWPVALFYALGWWLSGHRFQRPVKQPAPSTYPPRGFWRTLAWIMVWPAWFLMKFPITLSLRNRMRQQEYEADQAVDDAGYGDALISALQKLEIWEGARNGWEAVLYATHPPTALRISKLRPPTEDDADYLEPPPGDDSDKTFKICVWVMSLYVGLIMLGGFLAAHSPRYASAPASNAPATASAPPEPQLTPEQIDSAEHTAASFIFAYGAVAYNQAALDQVIAAYVPDTRAQAALMSSADARLSASPTNVTTSAQPIACQFLSASSKPTTAYVSVFFKWSALTLNEWLVNSISLQLHGTRWIPTDAPTIGDIPTSGYVPDPSTQNPTVPAGLGGCP